MDFLCDGWDGSADATCILQNDEIEKLALERSSLYRKCRLEEIKLPLLEGNLRNIPIEEVNILYCAFHFHVC